MGAVSYVVDFVDVSAVGLESSLRVSPIPGASDALLTATDGLQQRSFDRGHRAHGFTLSCCASLRKVVSGVGLLLPPQVRKNATAHIEKPRRSTCTAMCRGVSHPDHRIRGK